MTSPETLIAKVSAPMAPIVAAVIWAVVAAAWDLRTRRIPNWMTFPAALLGLVLNLALGGGAGLWQSALGTLTGLALLVIPFAMGGMGAGDVKMLAAVGALGGPAFAFSTFLYGSIAGGVIALVLMLARYWTAWRASGSDSAAGAARSEAESDGAEPATAASTKTPSSRLTFPYGVAILAGAIVTSIWR